MKKFFSLFVFVFVFPSTVFGAVRINEVSWMGTPVSSSNEWVELFNDGDTSQDVTNWTISISTKKLTGNIPARGFYLMERTDDSTVPNISADFIYTGALTDTGTRLVLKDATSAEVSVVDATSGWPAGDKDTKETMQWNGTGWITASATPKAENATTGTVKKDTTTTTTPTTETETPTNPVDTSAHMNPISLSDFAQKQEWYISAGRNRVVPAGVPVSFESYTLDAKGNKVQGVSSVWSFGDGGFAGGIKTNHTYKHQGDYIVVLNGSAGGNTAVSRAEMKVFVPKLSIEIREGDIAVKNNSEYEINLGGWRLQQGSSIFLIPDDTIIASKKEIIFPQEITEISLKENVPVEMLFPGGKIEASVFVSPMIPEIKTVPVVATTTPSIAVEKTNQASPQPIVKPKTNLASAIVAVAPKKVEALSCGGETGTLCGTTSPKTLVLKKPDGFFAKFLHFFGR